MSDTPEVSKHTPGKWTVIRRQLNAIGPKGYEVRALEGDAKVGLLIANINSGMSDVEANASLIASAPALLEENQKLKEELIRRIDYDSSMEKCANLINENTELRKENQRAMKLVGDTEYANSTLESQVADLREALKKAEKLISRSAIEVQRKEIQPYLSGRYQQDVESACFEDSLGIAAALAKTEPKQ